MASGERVTLKHYAWSSERQKPDRVVDVEYVRLTHIGSHELPDDDRAYDVLVNNERVGYVIRVMASTDTKIAGTRLRRAGRGRPAWRWNRYSDGEHNAPGLYPPNRADCVAKLLDYSTGLVER